MRDIITQWGNNIFKTLPGYYHLLIYKLAISMCMLDITALTFFTILSCRLIMSVNKFWWSPDCELLSFWLASIHWDQILIIHLLNTVKMMKHISASIFYNVALWFDNNSVSDNHLKLQHKQRNEDFVCLAWRCYKWNIATNDSFQYNENFFPLLADIVCVCTMQKKQTLSLQHEIWKSLI